MSTVRRKPDAKIIRKSDLVYVDGNAAIARSGERIGHSAPIVPTIIGQDDPRTRTGHARPACLAQ
jgi:hypothetical protein